MNIRAIVLQALLKQRTHASSPVLFALTLVFFSCLIYIYQTSDNFGIVGKGWGSSGARENERSKAVATGQKKNESETVMMMIDHI